MISNQIIQNSLEGIKSISRVDLGVIDIEGKVIAGTFEGLEAYESAVVSFVDSPAESQEIQGIIFLKIYDENRLEYVMLVKNEVTEAHTVGRMAAFQLEELLVAYKERYDRDNFIKNLLLDNLLLVDIYNRSKKLNIEPLVRRVVYVIESQDPVPETEHPDNNSIEVVRSLFSSYSRDFITAVDETSIILVREVREDEGYEELDKIARIIIDMLNTEVLANVHVAYGTIIDDIKDVSRSYKEARMAIEVGKIFYADKTVIAYNHLGIGRLIYQLPVQLCNLFIKESFAGKNLQDFDEETLMTVYKFFENNLNISETSRKLFIHRNTLVYRLDKLKTMTGLDLRIFEDAITFKMALMVLKYMEYMDI